jgi:UDP-N-acetylmuramate--alanine ligase
MKLENIHSVYFLGIGGIGMSALARWFKHNGKAVSGYDKTPTKLTEALESENIPVHFEDEVEAMSPGIRLTREGILVVYTPAIPKNHKQWAWLKEQGYEIMKRSQVLGLITKNMNSIAVAGTHGKTTTTSMIVHLLKTAGVDCTGFLGGISANYNTNMVLNEGEEAVAVIEADEFDRSFLTLFPRTAVVTAIDADHLDIYGDKEALKESFSLFVSQIDKGGTLFAKEGVGSQIMAVDATFNHRGYALSNASITAENLRIEEAAFVFDYKAGDALIENITLNVPGYHNVENMLAAISVTRSYVADDETIREGVRSYAGVKRRFEYIVKNDDIVYIDDYAHHPVEIDAFLRSVRDLYPTRKITAVFQPHLFSRTRDFAQEFSASLCLADELILLDIYPAREEPIPGITSAMLLEKVTLEKKMVCSKENLTRQISEWSPQVVLTIGAGDIDQMIEPIKRVLS